jgi:hypothetical protein
MLRIFNPSLYDAIQPYKVTDDKMMPWSYQFANPNGRPYHDDWGIMGKFSWAQPWQKWKRIDFAYRIPYPFRVKSGQFRKVWYPLDPNVPLSPGAVIETKPYSTVGGTYNLPSVLIDDAIDGGGWTQYEGYIGGEWRETYRRYSKLVFGKMMKHYYGLKCDTTVSINPDGTIQSDVMSWWAEVSLTFNKVSA